MKFEVCKVHIETTKHNIKCILYSMLYRDATNVLCEFISNFHLKRIPAFQSLDKRCNSHTSIRQRVKLNVNE